ncbi:hypothetical protein LNR78_004399 [Salmonella enterica]|nr:hypothetical protein [Salmonella enterica]ECS8314105.1 hypothetical protein [Salmonella enterica subsp. enterica serovar Panama]EDR7365400.1 hypothetical protein [Salmonella enterica subsp. enterica serovar Oslo]EDU8777379.1 hypothetical protein [Salmonella enterica subsp. enterica serovar Poona]EEN8102831.1 hypothetical protein [Salmonella enterica subsp. enterica serovar Give]
MAAFAALCLSGTSVYAASNGGPQEADATVSVTSPFSFTHTLTGQSFSAGQIVDGTTVAEGTVSTGGDNRINTVTLSWDRTVNPEFIFDGSDSALMLNGDTDRDWDSAVPIRFTADTPSLIIESNSMHKYNTQFKLTTPGTSFRYTVKVIKAGADNIFPLTAGDYRLAVLADISIA